MRCMLLGHEDVDIDSPELSLPVCRHCFNVSDLSKRRFREKLELHGPLLPELVDLMKALSGLNRSVEAARLEAVLEVAG